MKPKVAAMMASAMLLIAACSGSADPEPPALSTSSESTITESEAIAIAQATATAQGLATEDLDLKPGLLFGEWQVSFEPTGSDSLTGGFLVVLNAETGELIDVVLYQ